jgi:hypothetical protein
MITKEELLKGNKLVKTVTIKELGGEIQIRPLTEEQWAEIEARKGDVFDIEVRGAINSEKDAREKIKKGMQLNTKKLMKAEFEQNILACKYGLVMDITEDELRQISPPGIVKKIALEIYKISSINEEDIDALKSFRKK